MTLAYLARRQTYQDRFWALAAITSVMVLTSLVLGSDESSGDIPPNAPFTDARWIYRQLALSLVSATIVSSTVFLSALRSRRELALLRCLGASAGDVVVIVFLQSLFLLIPGIVIGLVGRQTVMWLMHGTLPTLGVGAYLGMLLMLGIGLLAGLGTARSATRRGVGKSIREHG